MSLSIGTSVAAHALARDAFVTEVEHQHLDETRAAVHSDGLSELGEEQQLRVQMAMDRLSKMMSTLSNISAKHAQTADAIIENMK